MQFDVEVGRDKYKIRLNVLMTEDGLNVLLTGGEKTHVGGVVLIVPRKSLTGIGTSCDSWVVPVSGHKDVIVAEKVGTIISREMNEVVSITAGIHIHNASPEDLDIIMKNCMEGALITAEQCRRLRTGQKA